MKKLTMIVLAGLIISGCSSVAEVAPDVPECEYNMGGGGGI